MNIQNLRDLTKEARKLANKLYTTPPAPPCSRSKDSTSVASVCLEREKERPLNRQERANGWTRRPFYAYNCENLCASCAAYFFAERAAQVLEYELRCALG